MVPKYAATSDARMNGDTPPEAANSADGLELFSCDMGALLALLLQGFEFSPGVETRENIDETQQSHALPAIRISLWLWHFVRVAVGSLHTARQNRKRSVRKGESV